MRKKTIAWLFIPGLILAIIGMILYFPAYLSFMSAAQTAAQSGSTTLPTFGGTFFLGIALLFIGGILNLIAWIGSLIATGKQGRWGWFVVVLLLSWLGQLIYLIGGPGL